MNIRVAHIPSDRVSGVGTQYTFKLDLNGFYVSPHLPLVIEAAVNMQNGQPLMFFLEGYAKWTKTTCKNSYNEISAEKKFTYSKGYPYRLRLEISHLLQNATYNFVLKVSVSLQSFKTWV